MRRWVRFLMRFFFASAMAALMYGMVCCPIPRGPSLYVTEILPLSRAATAEMPRIQAMPAAAPLVSVAEPEPDPVRPPAVPGHVQPLMYHHLTENPEETSAWTTTPEKFREDIAVLTAAGYLPLSLEDYACGSYDPGQDYFIVTFDDGYESNLTLALPILAELKIPASVFVITGSVGVDGHMTWDQLREIAASGWVTVYSHTESHMSAAENPAETFLADERTAWAKIGENLSPAMKVLSYPYGAFTRETMETLAAEGYGLFVIQDRPGWFTEENDAGIRIMVRTNVDYTAELSSILSVNRRRAALPAVEEAALLRAQRAAEDEAARLAQYEAWIAYAKAAFEAANAPDAPRTAP